jgi:RNA polymerase sigma-70 factor (ECF subfamily)
MDAAVPARAAFEVWLPQALPAAFRLAYAMIQDRQAAEDAVQEAAAIAWRRAGNVRDGADPLPWFLGIVANQSRRSRARRWLLMPLRPVTGQAETTGDGLAARADLRHALRCLNKDQRVVVLLHFYLDLPLDAVAEATDVPVGTVKSRLGRALIKLRAALGEWESSQ